MKFVRLFSLKAPDVALLLEETERFREHLALLACPSCTKKTLELVNYEQGPTGWKSLFFCTICSTKGELNSDGFHVELTKEKKKFEEQEDEEPKTKVKRKKEIEK
jgi:uncharacterized protein YbaR (Trm112 family)